jgi:argininosuccinate lyase
MLLEAGLLDPAVVRRLLAAIGELEASGWAPLRGRPAPRGLYLLYEHHLVETLGEEAGGAVHLARSRNDLNATVLRLRLRAPFRRLSRELLRLAAVLVHRAGRHGDLVFPLYTHHQAALPGTWGHWLAGVAAALLRDLRGVEDAAAELERCPLGAGAAGGTTLPIDPERTARLLGFPAGVQHSLDAVASRDLVLRLLSAAAVLGVTLSRVAADLQLWSTAEFGMVRFPDRLVGSSSMMPQKRNAFLLEHVTGRAGAALGAFSAAAMAMHATPFSNSVAVGTEGVRPLWSALGEVTEAVVLLRLCVAGAEPVPARMLERAVRGYTPATELANRIVRETGISFRRAHHVVGELVSEADERGEPLAAVADGRMGVRVDPAWLDPARVAAAAEYGGGPGGASLPRMAGELRAAWSDAARRLDARVRAWREGERALEAAVDRVLAGGPAPLAGPPPGRGRSGRESGRARTGTPASA